MIVDHIPAPLDQDETVAIDPMKYPKAGDPNPAVRLSIADVAGRKARHVDLEGTGYGPTSSSRGSRADAAGMLIARIQNRIQNWLDVVRIDPASGKVTRLFQGGSHVVGGRDRPAESIEGRVVPLAERPNRSTRHVYHFEADGKLRRRSRKGIGGARPRFGERGRGWIYFTATKDGSVGDNFYHTPARGRRSRGLTDGAVPARSRGTATARSSSIPSEPREPARAADS